MRSSLFLALLIGTLAALLTGCGGGGSQADPVSATQAPAVAASSTQIPTSTGTLLVEPSFLPPASAKDPSIEQQTASFEVWVLDDEETDVEAGPVTFAKTGGTVRVEGIPVDNFPNTVVVEAHDSRGETVGVSVQKLDIRQGEQTMGAQMHRSLSGTVRFDRVPVTDKALDYASITEAPIVNARVSLLDDTTGAVLLQTVSGADGTYRFDTQGRTGRVRVRVSAETVEPPMKVVDNTNRGALYAVDSGAVDVGTAFLDLKAPVRFVAGSGYTVRSGAPFACLEACRRATAAFRAARPAVVFPALTINWSVNNAPASGSLADGQIDTSHYNSGNLYILGKENQDTDEFDWHIMVHEWGHYYEDKLSRSDSIGGSHGLGDELDARVSLGEGWGNALSAIILYPDSMYRDTKGPNQATLAISYDLEDNTDANPGWASERSVQAIIYDVFDAQTDAEKSFDLVSLDLGVIHDVMTGPEKTTSALTTIFTFINGCQGKASGFTAKVKPLLARHSLQPVADDFGTGETNNGGDDANLPLYRSATVNGNAVTVSVTRDDKSQNRANSNRCIRIAGMSDGALGLTVRSSDKVRVDMFQNGKDTGGINYTAAGADDSYNLGDVKAGDAVILVVSGRTLSKTYDVSVKVTQ